VITFLASDNAIRMVSSFANTSSRASAVRRIQ
jgi:hypothetical protein